MMYAEANSPQRYYTIKPLLTIHTMLTFGLSIGELPNRQKGVLLSILAEPTTPARVRELTPLEQRSLAQILLVTVENIRVLTVYPDPSGAYPAEDNSVVIRRGI